MDCLTRNLLMGKRNEQTFVVSLSSQLHFRKPQLTDGAAIWSLIHDIEVLDLNSSYCYLMLTSYFRETCVITESGEHVAGFVSGFIPPDKPQTLFIWQVAVERQSRGMGIGTTMLQTLLARDVCRSVKYLETTVSPSNDASRAMFLRLARELDTEMKSVGEFSSTLFPHGHESEQLLKIGPF
ncbi:diaminobutyrate acetyltransferase [Alicyclobacillus mengziensis]|nr:diaminobutyrate acetyltransferase [Alicyclobacillus mengziensis]